MQRAAQAYLETQVTTTSQGQLLVMLYDGAVNFLERAKERMAAKDYAGKGNLISKALDILNELDSSLNADKGGDLADRLHQLYFYCSKRLFTANCKMDPAPIDEVIKILGGLRSAYAQIMDQPEAVAAAAQAAAAQRSGAAVPYRTPAGGGTGTVATPAASARAWGAYAQQSAPQSVPEAPAPQPKENACEPELPVAEALPAPEPEARPLEFVDDATLAATPPPVSRRMAASALYGKFAAHK